MNRYSVAVSVLMIRTDASKGASIIRRVPRGTELAGIELPENKLGETWAKNKNDFFCVKDKKTRYCDMLPQSAPLPGIPSETPGQDKSVLELINQIESLLTAIKAKL